MFGKKRNRADDDRYDDRPQVVDARGGVSAGAILTGAVVVFGALFLLSAIIGGVLAAADIDAGEVSGDVREASIGLGIALIVAIFLAALWGGYTAGRMGRGAGAVNGFLVAVLVILVVAAIWAIANALDATANLNLPFSTGRLPFSEDDQAVEFAAWVGIASLIALVVAAILGGGMGSRWHTKLERGARERAEADRRERRRRDNETADRERAEERAEREHRGAVAQTSELRHGERRDDGTGERTGTAPRTDADERSGATSTRHSEMPPDPGGRADETPPPPPRRS